MKFYQEFHDDGWMATWTVPAEPSREVARYRGIFSGTQVSTELIEALVEQTVRWTQQGVFAIGFRPPTTDAMQALEDKLSGFDENGFIRLFEGAGGRWIRIPSGLYESYDGSHLDKESAIGLSKDLAVSIRQVTEKN
jgi:hypothetical protein